MNSLWPILFSALWTDLEQPHRLDQNFAASVLPEQYFLPRNYIFLRRNYPAQFYFRSWDQILKGEAGYSAITANKDNYKIMINVQQFKPEEVKVNIADRFIVVEAKHEEKKDEQGYIARQFSRRFYLSEQADFSKIHSVISNDGILLITIPFKGIEEPKTERPIEVERTEEPALQPKESADKEEVTTVSVDPNAEEITKLPPK